MRSLLAFLLFLAPLALADSDFSGRWSGSMDVKGPDGAVNSTAVNAEIKQTGATVTGTAGAKGFAPNTVEKRAVAGDQLTFEVHANDGSCAVKATLITASQLKGEVTFTSPEGAKITASLTMTRN